MTKKKYVRAIKRLEDNKHIHTLMKGVAKEDIDVGYVMEMIRSIFDRVDPDGGVVALEQQRL